MVPDTRLLDKFSQITPLLFTPADETIPDPPLETLYIIDFFIALAICNTVVVSAPNQPRQKVRLMQTTVTFQKRTVGLNIFVMCSYCACVLNCFSRVQIFATPWTVACQAPLSMGILQARILEWVAMPLDLPYPGIELEFLHLTCIGRWVLYHFCHLGSCVVLYGL